MEKARSRSARPVPPRAARNYVFTVNFKSHSHRDGRMTFQHVPRLLDPELWPMCKYCIYSLELGEDGTHHFQGYLELNGVHRFTALKNLPGLERAHFEPRRGTQADCIKYCSKTHDPTHLEGPFIWGEPARQGQRSDLLDIQIKLDNKMPITEIAKDHFGSFIRYGKAFKEYKRITTVRRTWKTIVWLIIGPSGRGKSNFADSMARAIGSTFKLPPKKGSGLYFDDYDGQECVIIDEMNGNKCTPEFFNELCDRYELCVPFHGTAGTQFVAKHLFITTNYLPAEWWKKRTKEQTRQTMRRIDIVLKMGFRKSLPPQPQVLPMFYVSPLAPQILKRIDPLSYAEGYPE